MHEIPLGVVSALTNGLGAVGAYGRLYDLMTISARSRNPNHNVTALSLDDIDCRTRRGSTDSTVGRCSLSAFDPKIPKCIPCCALC
jgi:hypothetical protein